MIEEIFCLECYFFAFRKYFTARLELFLVKKKQCNSCLIGQGIKNNVP